MLTIVMEKTFLGRQGNKTPCQGGATDFRADIVRADYRTQERIRIVVEEHSRLLSDAEIDELGK